LGDAQTKETPERADPEAKMDPAELSQSSGAQQWCRSRIDKGASS